MTSSLFLRVRSAGVFVSLVASAALTACTPDQPTAPAVNVPTDASASLGSERGTLCLRCTPVGQIAYVKADPTKFLGGHIWIMNADTTAKTQLTFGTSDEDMPAWSPDYKKIAFTSNRRGTYELFVINADGTGLKALTTAVNGSRDDYPSWAPDGSKIYFARYTSDPVKFTWRSEIYSVNADGSGFTKVSNDRANLYMPTVSPDGNRIAVTRLASNSWVDARIFTMNTNGSALKQLTFGSTGDGDQAWSPDGSKLVYVCSEGMPDFREICVVNADGTGAKTLVMMAGEQDAPNFSRDGSRVIFETYSLGNFGRLITVQANGVGGNVLEAANDPMTYYSAAWAR